MGRREWLLLATAVAACGAPPAPVASPPPVEVATTPEAEPTEATAQAAPAAPRDPMMEELAVAPVSMGPPPPPPSPPQGLGRGGGGVGEGTIGLGTFGTIGQAGPPAPPRRIALAPDDPAPECDYRCHASERRARASAIHLSTTAIALRGRWEDVSSALEACFTDARVADPCLGDRAELELVVLRGGPVAVPGPQLPWIQCALDRIAPMRLDAALTDDATSGRIAVRVTWTPAERRWTMPGRIVVQPVGAGVCEPAGG